MAFSGWLRPFLALSKPSRRPAKARARRRLEVEALEERLVPTLNGDTLFPADNPWNQKITSAPVAANSATLVASIGATAHLHPDFGTTWAGALNGIPYNVVSGTQPKVNVVIDAYPTESDLVPVPIPANAVIEGDPLSSSQNTGDRHLIVFDQTNNIIYELYDAHRPSEEADGQWHADSEAVWNAAQDSFRTPGFTSADAAGLPILPGLVRPDEVLTQGVITHALRFTVPATDNTYVFPASHEAGSNNANLPPMGERFRLKASFDISSYPASDQVILQALKDYGMIVADNGSPWFLSGAPSTQWSDDTLAYLGQVPGSAFEAVDLTPIVSGLSVSSGAAGTTVVINGQCFSGGAGLTKVYFGGTAATFQILSDTQISVTVPSLAAGSTVDVTVVSPYGTSVKTTADRYTVTSGGTPAPAVSSLSPTSGPAAGGTVVTITGSNFTGATAVLFGTKAAASFSVTGATSITATAPAGSAGTVNVFVTTAGGTSAQVAADQFTYTPPAPAVSAISPSSGPTGGGTVVTITGSNFTGATAVLFGGKAAASFSVAGGTSITATAPAGSAGTVDVVVTTAGGTSAAVTADRFTYTVPTTPAPAVTSLSPTSGSTAGGTVVTITGTHFTGATAVLFGSTAAAAFTVGSDSSITATAPAGSAGTVDVVVTTAGGTSAAVTADRFTYTVPTTPAPAVTSLSPTSGSTAGGTVVTITGTHFTGATAVLFGSTPATAFTVGSDSSITATAPAGSAGTVDVIVTTAGGSSPPVTGDHFTYTAPVTQPAQLQFSAAAYTVLAAAGSATITVTRGVTTTTAVTVHYATSNGTAVAGTNYTAASGTLTFAAGQTSATFTVSVANTMTVGGSETVNLTLSSPGSGAALGAVSTAVLTIQNNGVTANQRFVAQLYVDLLHRPVDLSGLNGWTGWLDAGGNRILIVNAIMASLEYRQMVVQTLYQTILGRAADPSGLSSWAAWLGQGGNERLLKAYLLGSSEFYAKAGGTNQAFLQALYQNVLNRPLDPTGAQAWGQALAQGMPRTSAAWAILNSTEAETLSINTWYTTYLRRPADASSVNSLLYALQQGVLDEQVIAVLVASDEYYARA